MKKKFLSVLLVLTMVLTMIPMATGVAWAVETSGTCGDGVAWELTEGNTVLTISGNGTMTNFAASDKQPWASYKGVISTVSIGADVTSIGAFAFNGCSSLTDITIPASITSIAHDAFNGCSSLATVTFIEASQLATISNNAFSGCSSLTNITIPASVTNIGSCAFLKCSSLGSIIIPKSITSIGSSAFSDCSNLTTVTFDSDSQLATLSSQVFYNCASLTSITIPSSVTSVESSAFNGCKSLANITIPTSVTSIGNGAFYNCASLTSITIPASVTSIGDGAFYSCASFTSITIPASVTKIGKQAFQNCSKLATVTCLAPIPPTLGQDAFKGCASPTSIYVPDGKEFDYVASWTQYAANIVVSIADILATVDGEFPETVDTGWVNGNGAHCYLDGSKLMFAKDAETKETASKTASTADASAASMGLHWADGNYAYTPFAGYSLTFNMEDYKLASITFIDVPVDGTTSFSGTYTVPTPEPPTPSIGYFAYDVEKYREILAEAQKQQAVIDAEIAPVKPGEEEKPVGTPITEEQAKALVTEMVPVVRTENQAKGIKVFLQDSPAINRFKAAGYKVLYDFYRAESKTAPKSEDYKITTVVNKEEPWYLNTAAKKGKRYYYKVVAKVYDTDGNLVGETELDQAAYGYRTRK